MSSGLRSSVQNAMNGEWRSVMIGASACRSLETEPSRTRICMPLASFSSASGTLVDLMVGADAGAQDSR